MLEPGQQAPPFECKNHAGETVALDDFDGRVVVYFYPRADTPGCTTEACSFRDSWDEFAERDVTVLGISDDPVSDLEKFREKYDLPFELLSDESGEVASAYDSYGEKNMFGNTFDGVFRNTFVVASDGTIEHVFADVSPDGHAEEILSTLE
ncbi:thioredoxin-dependent thiol peroxidase [Haladaptatus sp. DFWS20]|uniref:thioredoxin-dependent thiol peroxidase n=1 Tax=Haladaptatus sp. DFWS20 TaxID=3403467 RepID=UPI003EBDD67C